MVSKMLEFLKSSKGATAIEYALIASLIAVVAIAGFRMVGNQILDQLNNIADNLENTRYGNTNELPG